MNINDVFASKFLRASDLQGLSPVVTISSVEFADMQDGERKLLLKFMGKEKGMVLNKTNAQNIASMYGPETDRWVGNRIKLTVALVDYQGKSVEAIRVWPSVPPGSVGAQTTSQKAMAAQAPSSPAFDVTENPADLNDEAPF
jgi:hypothetical protein